MENVLYGSMDLVAGLFLLGVLGTFGGFERMVALFMVAKGALQLFP
jgi:hypothetical protein